MTVTDQLGKRGEAAALKYLIKNNYNIIAVNYKSGHKEIDIIAKKGGKYIFIEVKTRLKNKESSAENPLSFLQVKNLKAAILNYARENKLNLDSVYLDLIFILVDKKKNRAELRHYRDIF
ncbi:MAG: YraN family protein [Patescibacteria group bacterium]